MASGGGEEGEFGLQIAPMLDVMFVLLLFFMVSAGANEKEQELGVKVPGEGKSTIPGTPTTPILVTLDAEGVVFYNGSPVGTPADLELNELRAQLKRATEALADDPPPVIIAPSAKTVHSRLINVLDAASYAGVKKLSFRAPADSTPK
ncbi:MAG: biopolymer transporter ExbD [Candidatus Methylacidiphilales bacterium]|nr:biopolymer transporter ExbD [Candidatus Methylacidiphilales bacterium]